MVGHLCTDPGQKEFTRGKSSGAIFRHSCAVFSNICGPSLKAPAYLLAFFDPGQERDNVLELTRKKSKICADEVSDKK